MNSENLRGSLDLAYGESDETIKILKAENAALKDELVKLKALYEVSGDILEGGINDFSRLLPVVGKDLEILSRAFQNFPNQI